MQQKIEFAPSFSCYSTDGITSTAVSKVIREEELAARIHENVVAEGDDFEFSLMLTDEELPMKEFDSRDWTVYPVFKRDLLVNNEADSEIKAADDEIDASSAITDPIGKLFIGEREESSSYSSSEAYKLEIQSPPSGSKCKKSSSTGSGSGSKKWIIRYLLRRSNSEGKQPTVLLTPTTVDSPKHKRISGEVSKSGFRWKAQTPVHEQFYTQRRAEIEIEKRKSYLPYRKDLVANVNGMTKMLPSFLK